MAYQMQSLQPTPAEVQQLAEVHSLGAPTASYSQKSFVSLFTLLILFFGLLSFIIAFFITTFFILFNFSFGPLIVEPFLLISIAFFGWIVICVYLGRRLPQIHMYTEGFVFLIWRKAEVLRWDQIETIWHEPGDSQSNGWVTLRIRKTDGIELELGVRNVLRDSSELYRTIEREFVRIRLPGVIEQYEAGHSIAFGNLSVNKLGLTRKGETLPWSQVQSIDVGDQRVTIKKEGQKRGNWFKDSVPNQSLLRELVSHIRNSQ